MSQCPAKRTSWHVGPSKTHDQSFMGALWVSKGSMFLQPENLGSDQTADVLNDLNIHLPASILCWILCQLCDNYQSLLNPLYSVNP